ncbi:MAG: lipopolysaccharide biosynthesis protein, partial [Chloroflexota bacterium]
ISLVFFRGLDFWAPALEEFGSTRFLAGWFIVSTMAWSVFSLQDYALTGLRQAVWVPIENAGFSVAKITLLVGFARAFPHYGLFASWTIGMALTLLPVNALIFRRLIPRHMAQAPSHLEPFMPTQVVRYMAADYVGSLCWLASTALLPLLVTQQAGDTANAYFYLSWQIALFLFLMSSNMGSSLIVEAASDPAKLYAYGYRVFIQIARMVVPAAIILALGAPYILRVFGNSYAAHSVWTLRLLALAAIPFIANSLYTSISRVRRNMKAVVKLQLASCVLVLTLSHFLLEIYGIVGVGMAWLASQTLLAVILLMTTDLRFIWSARRDEIGHHGSTASDPSHAAASADDHAEPRR